MEAMGIREIQRALQSGEITCRELVMNYMERIANYDKSGVKINSILEINPDALHIAEVLDYEKGTIGQRGALYGIPILIKDNINTGDKMHTSAGSLALADSYAEEDAFIVKKLREAGAIILGKTNMTEFANFMSYNMENGYSSRGGQVLNPYGPGKFDVGGSSSGSGAAVAANFCTAAIGTETSGSILSPSCQNSLVGIKPTVGLISRNGIIPLAHSQDTAGPMCRTVEDAAIVLGALTGSDVKDPVTFTSRGRGLSDYAQFLDYHSLQGARIGIPREHYFEELTEDQRALMEDAISLMAEHGALIVEDVQISTAKDFDSASVLFYEFKSDINAYLSSLRSSSKIKTLKDIIDFNIQNSEAALKYGQQVLIDSDKTSGTLTEPEYINNRIKDIRLSQTEGIDKAINEYSLDAVLFPGTAGADIAARAGYPSITVPAGYTKVGEPFGITFTSIPYSEPILIKLAYSYEQYSKKRLPPNL
ncbi:amidase family protein [Clostridium swellfunianum]|uniref:amidase family protein n=1 Tax=Clostridium swellfunianum TaxID=1367462 RepID=UPI00202E27F7|nr:amidase family protein [Clostridium swellfunianum]MCM0648336.1 amidase family protein [Clostridium swellfunianum]